MHYQATVHLSYDLKRRVQASGTCASAADAAAAAQKRLIFRESGEFDGGFAWIIVFELYPSGFVSIPDELEGLFAAILEFLYELLADFVVGPKHAYASGALPGKMEGHQVLKSTTRIKKTTRQNDQAAIGGAILQTHDQVTIGSVFGQHGAEA
jgi:hypothetical protein